MVRSQKAFSYDRLRGNGQSTPDQAIYTSTVVHLHVHIQVSMILSYWHHADPFLFMSVHVMKTTPTSCCYFFT